MRGPSMLVTGFGVTGAVGIGATFGISLGDTGVIGMGDGVGLTGVVLEGIVAGTLVTGAAEGYVVTAPAHGAAGTPATTGALPQGLAASPQGSHGAPLARLWKIAGMLGRLMPLASQPQPLNNFTLPKRALILSINLGLAHPQSPAGAASTAAWLVPQSVQAAPVLITGAGAAEVAGMATGAALAAGAAGIAAGAAGLGASIFAAGAAAGLSCGAAVAPNQVLANNATATFTTNILLRILWVLRVCLAGGDHHPRPRITHCHPPVARSALLPTRKSNRYQQRKSPAMENPFPKTLFVASKNSLKAGSDDISRITTHPGGLNRLNLWRKKTSLPRATA
jgi:hypothetical protein